MSVSNGPSIVTSGLVLSLDAADKNSYPGSGTTWRDLSGNGNNGTLTNGPTFSSANQGSIVFDGTNDYVNCNDLDITTNNITLSSWFKSSTNASGLTPNRLISKELSYLLQYDSQTDEYQSTIVIYSGATYVGVSNPNNLTSNNWYNLVGTYDGTSMRVYTNGVLSNVKTISFTINQSNNNLEIGGDSIANYNFNGNIASTQIYNRALSASEIAQNYSATKTRFGL